MWAIDSVFYQIYPFGFCGAPKENDGITVSRIQKVVEWIPHLKKLNIGAVYFSPVFESDKHGYDTRDYKKIDCRLGTNEDFAKVCKALKENGIGVVLDGVFNHVGRGFPAFKDVIKNRENSCYKDWFYIKFDGNSCYDDGFYYEGWEGHYELVKLNLKNPDVVEHLLSCVQFWMDNFQINGLRLDVAYCLDEQFIRRLRSFCDSLNPDFFLMGEILFGDYKRIVNPSMLHSCTNYECYKGLYSSFNDLNLFEICHSLSRQFGENGGSLYQGQHFLSFAENHDVTRVASMLKEVRHLPLLYGLLFAMPGIPCIYYGGEWGEKGMKGKGSDDEIRPNFDEPKWNSLTELISTLSLIHRKKKALIYGDYKSVFLTNRQLVFQRKYEDECIWIAINADSEDYDIKLNDIEERNSVTNLISGESISPENGYYRLPPFSLLYLEI